MPSAWFKLYLGNVENSLNFLELLSQATKKRLFVFIRNIQFGQESLYFMVNLFILTFISIPNIKQTESFESL